ncbi:hypothetical protein IAR55_005221 [Kwoniella newhampshirensis]|uniref:Protein YAE1 n=1 Tax=Kwoniella newhampshirensis TaxID=1651941 RepID=A0AAW0YW00_9TREE
MAYPAGGIGHDVSIEMDEDDWYAPPTQGGAEDPLVDQEYTRLSSRYADAGYREGITDGKLSTLQRGFDDSFAASVPLSRQIGQLRGKAAALLAYISVLPLSSSSAQGVSVEDDLRELVRELGRLRRDQILPEDLERVAHERDEHGEEGRGEGGYVLDGNEKRDMESLERSLELLSGSGSGEGRREDGKIVLEKLEERLQDLGTKVKQ